MTTFVLVHGAFHGAWCWQPLIDRLAAAGHDAVAVDLPIDDKSARWEDHVNAVLDAAAGVSGAVLVGHSRAGRLLPLVLERGVFDGVVHIATSLPSPAGQPARRCDTIPTLLPAGVDLVRDDLGRLVCPQERAAEMYFHDCTPETRDWALTRLRPQFEIEFPPPQTSTNVRSIYIAGVDDRAVNIAWMRAAAKEVLGLPAIELHSGHSPFLSVTQELSNVLDAFAKDTSRLRKAPSAV